MARSRSRLDKTPFQTDILDLSHDGRGVARREGEGGKVTFINGALPQETVMAEQTGKVYVPRQAITLIRAKLVR